MTTDNTTTQTDPNAPVESMEDLIALSQQASENITDDTAAAPRPASTGDDDITAAPETTPEVAPENVVTTEPQANPAPSGSPEWSDFTYKVRDEVKTVDDWAKPFIKDEQTHKQFTDLFTAREGIALAKTERETARNELTALKNDLTTVANHINNGDIDSFCHALNLPKQIFIDYARQQEAIAKLPQAQQQAYFDQQQQTRDFHNAQAQVQSFQQQTLDQQQQIRDLQLQSVINSPSVAAIAQQFDATRGIGAFATEARNRGLLHAMNTQGKEDLSAVDAVNQVITTFGLNTVGAANQTQTQQVVGATAQHPSQTVITTPAKQTIANTPGKGSAPVEKMPSSIDDLIALREAL